MVTPKTFEATTITPMTVVGEAGITMILRFGLLFLGWSVKVPFPGLAPVDSGSVLIVVSSLSNKFIKEQIVVGVVPAAPAVVDPAAPAVVDPAALVDPVISLDVVPAGRLVVVETSPHTCIEKTVTSIGCVTSKGVMTTSMLATPSGLVAGSSNVPWNFI